MNSGKHAEGKAAEFLRARGFEVIDQNWRRPYAEIDIIAKKHNCFYFVEVKYRKNNYAGDAISYVTRNKLKSMERAASWWMQENSSGSCDYVLSAIALEDNQFTVVDFIEQI